MLPAAVWPSSGRFLAARMRGYRCLLILHCTPSFKLCRMMLAENVNFSFVHR